MGVLGRSVGSGYGRNVPGAYRFDAKALSYKANVLGRVASSVEETAACSPSDLRGSRSAERMRQFAP